MKKVKKSRGTSVKVRPEAKPRLQNRVGLVLDRSGSMAHLGGPVVKAFNEQINTLKEESKRTEIETDLTFVTFSTTVDPPIHNQTPVDEVPLLPDNWFQSLSSTALYDAIAETAKRMKDAPVPKGVDLAYLLFVITDGQENASVHYDAPKLASLIRELQGSGSWTIVFCGPPGTAQTIHQALEIPKGNIREWEATAHGYAWNTQVVNAGVNHYFGERLIGARASTSFISSVDENTQI